VNGLRLVASTPKGRAIWHVSLRIPDSVAGRRQAALTGAWIVGASDDLANFTVGRILIEEADIESSLSY
jgi:hypothetical protein